MPKLPYAYRPSVIIRGKALRKGLFGPSTFWKLVAAVVFGRSTVKKMFGRNEQLLDTMVLKGGGRLVQVETIREPTRRQRRRAQRRAARAAKAA
jgi:hypothetical protein